MMLLFLKLLLNVLGVKIVVVLILQDHDRAVFARIDVKRIDFAGLLDAKLLLNAHATPVAALSWRDLSPAYEMLAATPLERVHLDLKPRRFP
jgi:hypothetical protein